MTKVLITMVNNDKYEVTLNCSPNDLQFIVDEITNDDLFIFNRPGKYPRLLKVSNIVDIEIL